MKNLKQLAEISNGKLSGSSINVDSFSIDTRTINPNEAYIALKGENFDGHEFISEALVENQPLLVVINPELGLLIHCIAVKEACTSKSRKILAV